MNNLYQDSLWNYTDCNKDFYNKASSNHSKVDWSWLILQLKTCAGISICELSRHLEHYKTPSSERRNDLSPLRDHIEGLVCDKQIKELREEYKPIALELCARHVPPERIGGILKS